MRYISLFSGVEAATLAWERLGWEPVAFAEVDPFPAAVLARRFPDIPNLGDVTKVDWSKYRGTVELVAGGFPCQAYSIAGLRKGLAEPRGQLMLEFLRACREIDPEWIVGENVPGLLSSHGGDDFQTFLEAVAILWPRGGVCWRVLDAQFARIPNRDGDGRVTGWFGPVAQRRRRVFLVVNTRDWRRAAAVLAESEGVFGGFETSQQKREALAADAARGSGTADCAGFNGGNSPSAQGGVSFNWEVAPTMKAGDSGTSKIDVLCMASHAGGAEIARDISPTILAHAEKTAPTLVRATVPTCSQVSAQQTAQSSSSTTSQSMADGSSSAGGGASSGNGERMRERGSGTDTADSRVRRGQPADSGALNPSDPQVWRVHMTDVAPTLDAMTARGPAILEAR